VIDYYAVMGITPSATVEEIKARYRFLVFVYHPDRFTDPEHKVKAEEEFKRITEAYQVLCNAEKRAAYDFIYHRRSIQNKTILGNENEDETPPPTPNQGTRTSSTPQVKQSPGSVSFLRKPEMGCLLVFIIIIGFIIFLSWVRNFMAPEKAYAQPTVTAIFTYKPSATHIPINTRTPTILSSFMNTPDDLIINNTLPALNGRSCVHWDQVNSMDIGDDICVFGYPIETYSRDGAFFIIFSKENSDFYFLSYGDFWFEGMVDNCIIGEGEVKKLGSAPVIVTEEYWYCE